jgi:hypothetical protein
MPTAGAGRAGIVDELLRDEDPGLRWRTRVMALGEEPDSDVMRTSADDVRESARVRALLAHRNESGRITGGRNVYAKWQGAHWILAHLADLGYPPGDATLFAVRDQILDHWLAPEFYEEYVATTKSAAYRVSSEIALNADFVGWGGAGRNPRNPWVTTAALSVLRRAGRWQP